MRVLMFGGSWTLGRLITETLARDGFEVTVFNSGRNPEARPPVPDQLPIHRVYGDRRDAATLRALAESGPWHAVIDISGKTPDVVRVSARALAEVTGLYLYVSAMSVYRGWPQTAVDEQSPLLSVDPDQATTELARYGAVRRGSELACSEAVPEDRLAVVRLHTILGQLEDTGGLRWWLLRMNRGGPTLVPRTAGLFQAVDVHDLATFLCGVATAQATGVFNAVAPAEGRRFADLIRVCADVAGRGDSPDLVWSDEDWLRDRGVGEGAELPMWQANAAEAGAGNERAVAAGLRCRPFIDTVSAVWRWMNATADHGYHPRFARYGMDADRERALLAQWRSAGARPAAPDVG